LLHLPENVYLVHEREMDMSCVRLVVPQGAKELIHPSPAEKTLRRIVRFVSAVAMLPEDAASAYLGLSTPPSRIRDTVHGLVALSAHRPPPHIQCAKVWIIDSVIDPQKSRHQLVVAIRLGKRAESQHILVQSDHIQHGIDWQAARPREQAEKESWDHHAKQKYHKNKVSIFGEVLRRGRKKKELLWSYESIVPQIGQQSSFTAMRNPSVDNALNGRTM